MGDARGRWQRPPGAAAGSTRHPGGGATLSCAAAAATARPGRGPHRAEPGSRTMHHCGKGDRQCPRRIHRSPPTPTRSIPRGIAHGQEAVPDRSPGFPVGRAAPAVLLDGQDSTPVASPPVRCPDRRIGRPPRPHRQCRAPGPVPRQALPPRLRPRGGAPRPSARRARARAPAQCPPRRQRECPHRPRHDHAGADLAFRAPSGSAPPCSP